MYNVDRASAGEDFHHASDDTWQEETVTWTNAPTADAGILASLGAVSANTWYEVNLTSYITGDGTYSLRISDSQGGADYSSKEGANAPKLLVAVGGATPQSCSGTATATPTSGATNTPTQTPTAGPSPTPTNTSTPTSAPTATQPPPGAFNNATFVYDGDGRRVKSVFNNNATTTYFVGTYYEVTGSTITKYYFAGSQRIAMRTNGTLNYLLGDHLGSTSLVTDSSGNKTNEQRYKAWGETRYTFGNEKTKYQYTGQFSYTNDFGLMFYNARWYDPNLGRFAQADTITPRGVQGPDRYAYVNNSPINYIDPSGHCATDDETDKCSAPKGGPGTVDDFHNMSWAERKAWLNNFVNDNGLKNWFDDIKGAIDILSNDPDYQDMDGWAAYIDAAILQAINDGWRIFKGQSAVGGGGGAWALFFDAFEDGWETSNPDGLIALRLAGEQGGVDYGVSLSETSARFNKSDPRVQLKIGLFLAGANEYRSIGISCRGNGTCSNNIYTDPRTAVETPLFQILGQAPDFVSSGIWGPQIHPYGYP